MKRDKSARYPLLLLAVLVVLTLITVPVCVMTVQRGKDIASEETDRYLAELAKQATYKVNQRVEFNLELLNLLGRELTGSSADRDASISSFVANGPFAWIGTVSVNGILAVEGQEARDVSDLEVVQRALAGESSVSDTVLSVFSTEKGALYAAPIGNGPEAVVGWIPPERMQLLLGTDSADGMGFADVVAANGDFVLKSKNANSFLQGDNVLNALETQVTFEDGSVSDLRDGMAEGKSGHVRFSLNGDVREMSYVPLDKGGWYLLSVVPPSAYSSTLSEFTTFSVAGMAFFGVLVAFAAFGALVIWLSGRNKREIEKIAYVDPVTGGHTAVRFDQLLTEKMEERGPFTFVSLDIKDFKLVNDFFGKEKGDRVLEHVYNSLAKELAEGEFAARVSSDAFNVVLDGTDEDRTEAWLDRMASKVNEFKTGDTPYVLTLSCGAYVVDGSSADIVTIRDRANTARKNASRSVATLRSLSYYSDSDFERMLHEKELENRMDDALANGEFVAYLQPKVNLATGHTVGAEALVRWEGARNLGIVPPERLHPLLRTQRLRRQGRPVRVRAGVPLGALRGSMTGWSRLPISVNLSPVHLQVPRVP